METFEILLNGTLRVIKGDQGVVYPIIDGRLLLSKRITFRPGTGGRCVELDIEVDGNCFRQKVSELAVNTSLFSVVPPEEE